MASFNENFDSGLANWFSPSGYEAMRTWSIQSGHLQPGDPGLVYPYTGLILYNTPLGSANGVIDAEFETLSNNTGQSNLIVFRYTDDTHFVHASITPSNLGVRGVSIGFDSFGTTLPGTGNVDMYDTGPGTLADRLIDAGNTRTQIPQSGNIKITFTGNVYDIELYDDLAGGTLIATGQYVDATNSNINPGYVGFASNDFRSNMFGWDYINVTDDGEAALPPIIQSFSATDYALNLGESTDLGWVVTSGSETTSVELYPSATPVSLIGTSLGESPVTTTTYGLSAWNSVGWDYEEFEVTVANTFPIIESFTNNGPLSASTSAELSWVITSGTATSAFIDNGIGWVDPYSDTGTISTVALYDDITYTMTACDADLDTDVESTTVDIQQLPSGTLTVDGAPTCSGSPFDLIWNTINATSAYIDNGIGAVALDGTMQVSASVPTTYTLSAVNSLGIEISNANATIYYRDPIAYAGADVNVNSTNGSPVSVSLDGTASYDPDNVGISYAWYDGATQLSINDTFTYDYPVGTTTVTLIVTDNCGKTGTDTLDVVVTSKIPPIAVAEVNTNVLNAPGPVTLNGSNSSDSDGYIVSYQWYYQGNLIGNQAVITNYNGITTYGVHTFTLVVTDDDGLTGEDTVVVFVTDDANPKADAGSDQETCFSSSPTTITFDGSNSENAVDADIVWYEYALSAFGTPGTTTVSGDILTLNEISATFDVTTHGEYSAILTVSASNGYDDSDPVEVTIYERPTISASNVSDTIDCGKVVANVDLSAYSNATNPQYVWMYDGVNVSNEQFPSIPLGKGDYDYTVHVVDGITSCKSDTETVTIQVDGSDLSITEFSVTPSNQVVYDDGSIDVELTWDVSGATDVGVEGVWGYSNNGSDTVTINSPGGVIEFTMSATDGDCLLTQSVFGNYEFTTTPIDICFLRKSYVKTYGLDELKFGKDRHINLVNYLPEYARNSQTESILSEFEGYLNNMYTEQSNYTWAEKELEITVNDTKDGKQWTSCNDIEGCAGSCSVSGDCNNYASSAVENTYEFTGATSAGIPLELMPITPADSAGEVFVNNMCDIQDDKISILDKIFRLTELFDPDLMPEDLIQNYAENLGYSAGIGRDSMTNVTDDPEAKAIEQRRYLRFMIRNLPNWYQIKSSKPSIKIMLYSFGIIGDFVYYYTKCYSDELNSTSVDTLPGSNKDLCTLSDDDGDGNDDGTDAINNSPCKTSKYIINDCDDWLTETPGVTTVHELAKLRACLGQYSSTTGELLKHINEANNIPNDDWELTSVNINGVEEDLSPIKENEGYFSSPHFKLWVNIDGSSGNYSTDGPRQEMINAAVNAVKPINTVFDGVAVYWEAITMMYQNSKMRFRKYISIVSDGTYQEPDET